MREMTLLAAVFVAGLLVRDLVRFVWIKLTEWRWEQEYQLAKERMERCKHSRVTFVDVGSGPVTTKCLDCWALRDHGDKSRWYPNVTRPPK